MNTYQLFFGRNIPSGGTVTDSDFTKFLYYCNTVVDGYTVQDVSGVWKGEKEDTKLMTICTDNREGVYEIARAYRDAFNQDSVAVQILPAMEFV
jgi:hypothetical protein